MFKSKTGNQRHLPVLVFEIELILFQIQKRATRSIFHSQFHSFASTLDLWKVAGIKGSNEKPERATTGNEIR